MEAISALNMPKYFGEMPISLVKTEEMFKELRSIQEGKKFKISFTVLGKRPIDLGRLCTN